MVKNPPASAGDTSLIPESGRFPGEEKDNRLDHKIRIGTQCRDDGLDLRADIPKAEHRVTCSGNGPWVSGPTLPPGAAEMLMFELCCQETSRLSRLEAAG